MTPHLARILFLALPFLSNALAAQAGSYRFGGGLDDGARAVAATADGGWIVAGTVRPAPGESDGALVRLAADGSIAWQQHYDETSFDGFDGVAELAGGALCVAGWNQTALLLDAAGTITWQRHEVDPSGDSHADLLAVTADALGRAVFGGGSRACALGCTGGPTGKAITQVHDAAGTFLAGQVLTPWASGAGSEFPHEVLGLVGTASGDHVVAGWHWPTPDTPRAFAARFDASGTRLWHLLEDVTIGSGTYWARLTSVCERDDGTLLFAGSKFVWSLNREAAWLLAVTSDGVPLWERLLPGSVSSRLEGLAAGANGEAVAVGQLVDAAGHGGADLWAVKVDAAGDVLWQHAFGGTDEDRAFEVAPAPDGGWVVVGETGSQGAGGLDGWILRLNAAGWSCALATATAITPVPWTSLLAQPMRSDAVTGAQEIGASFAPAGTAGVEHLCPTVAVEVLGSPVSPRGGLHPH